MTYFTILQFLLYFCSNKCSLCEYKRLIKTIIMIIIIIIECVLQENTVSVLLLQNVMFRLMCYLPYLDNVWEIG